MTKRDRKSSTDSSDRVGRCAMSTCSLLSEPTRYMTGSNSCGVWGEGVGRLLLGVVLDDQLLLDRDVDLGPDRELVDEDPHPSRDRLEPRGDDALAVGLTSHDERRHLQRLLAHVDHVV